MMMMQTMMVMLTILNWMMMMMMMMSIIIITNNINGVDSYNDKITSRPIKYVWRCIWNDVNFQQFRHRLPIGGHALDGQPVGRVLQVAVRQSTHVVGVEVFTCIK